jgi:predicted metal-dependent phosphoesterase TrpH
MFKLDLHTHSIESPDGGLRRIDYHSALQLNRLDMIAITDHNSIQFAVEMRKQLGSRVIVGEEIMTTKGEIIGLFLKERIAPGLSPEETIRAIRLQSGLVYIPHPFETVRSGLSHQDLAAISTSVDIIEIFNGRAVFQNRSTLATLWAHEHNCAGAASSDAHGRNGWARTYTCCPSLPDRSSLTTILGASSYHRQTVGIQGVGYPKLNRLRKKFSHA